MREGGPIMRRQGAMNWRAIACPPLGSERSASRPIPDRAGLFLWRIWEEGCGNSYRIGRVL